MEIKDLKSFFREVTHISSHYEKVAKITGGNFNVFKIFNLQSSEVRLHSSFLAELLNPKGSHEQGSIFLDLFLKQFNMDNFDSKTAFVEIEKPLGFINSEYSQGGRIDLIISNLNDQNIIIENKIYAADQKNQLLRYHNYNPTAHLFYLSLYGDKPSKDSLSEFLGLKDITTISYSTDIIEWLGKCQKESANLPIIRESINQYVNLIKSLTNQTSIKEMKEEIKDLLIKDPDYLLAIDICNQVVQSIVSETKTRFKNQFKIQFEKKAVDLKDGITLVNYWGEDSDGVFIGYCLKKDEKNISGSEKGLEYRGILKEIYPNMYSNAGHVGWFNPKPFSRGVRFERLDKKEILQMYNDNYVLEKLINELVKQDNQIWDVFIQRIQNDIFP